MAGEELTPRVTDALYTEAMLLADEARAYFDGVGRDQRRALAPALQVGFACEAMAVTTRLMHVMSWLLARRADGVAEPLAGAPAPDARLLDDLPEAARAIVEASCELHARIGRLDVAGTGGVHAGPARSLLGRLERAF